MFNGDILAIVIPSSGKCCAQGNLGLYVYTTEFNVLVFIFFQEIFLNDINMRMNKLAFIHLILHCHQGCEMPGPISPAQTPYINNNQSIISPT